MANTKLLFYGTKESGTNNTDLEVSSSLFNTIFIQITDMSDYSIHLDLDKHTAVRLVRELKKQIGNLKTDE